MTGSCDVRDAADRPCRKSQAELSLIDLSFQRGHENGIIFLHCRPGGDTLVVQKTFPTAPWTSHPFEKPCSEAFQ